MEQYSLNKKRKLADIIHKIDNKKDLKKIKDIIYENNPEISVIQTNSTLLMYFHNLNNNTYYLLDEYISNIANISSDDKSYNYQNTQKAKSDEINNKTKYKYSNMEKSIIKSKMYNEELLHSDSEFVIKFDNSNSTENKHLIFMK